MTSATDLATWLVDEVIRLGVQHVVLAPGSRSAPLAFVLSQRAACGDLTLHTRIDERTAAFLALGMAKVSGRPAVVVTTSGTAVANLHPAMLEAAHAGVPLIAVTADRPATLRGTGANQTTDQVGVFGEDVPCVDLAEVPAGPLLCTPDSPIQINLQFSEPLVPSPSDLSPRASDSSAGVVVEVGPRTVVVAGDDGAEAVAIAQAGGWPLLAEPTSGARWGAHALRTYRLLLDSPLAAEIERVIVTGHPTLSRPVSRLLAHPEVEVISVRAKGRWPRRPFPVAAEADEITILGAPQGDWLARWHEADRERAARVDHYVGRIQGLAPYAVAAEVAAAVPEGGLLWVGASNPIRDLDLMMTRTEQPRLVTANRGLAGIDGTLSSAIGAALAIAPTRAIAYLGDVTFLHDVTALVRAPWEPEPDLSIVVANDNGGSIFATLEQGAPDYAEDFERLFATPHGVDLAALCASVRVPHWRVESRAELAHALANPNGGIEVIEAVIPRADRRRWDRELRGLGAG